MPPRAHHPHLLRRIASLTVGATLVLFIGACTKPVCTSGGADAAADQLVERAAHAAALSRAAESGSAAEIARLVEAGADVTMQDGDGVTPLHLAARFNPDPSVVGALLDAGADVHARVRPGAWPARVVGDVSEQQKTWRSFASLLQVDPDS
ncbi:MAG: ankyrin repeat domain-containing protein [bacterium]